MNNIVFAGADLPAGIQTNKYLEIFVPDKGEITVIPPLCEGGARSGGVHILIEQALINAKQTFNMPDEKNGGIRHAAAQAAEYFGGGRGKSQAVLSALGNLLAGYISVYLNGGDSFSPVVEQVREAINKNVSNPTFYLETEIKKLPLNYDYIRKLFKKETGATPHDYLLKQRMELAAQLLTGGIANRYSKYTVSQIAEACGFTEPLYFSRVFKKYYGVAPSDYAK